MGNVLGKTGINNTQNVSYSAKTSTNILCLDLFITPFIYSIYFMFDQVDTTVSRLLLAWATAVRHWITRGNISSFHEETICFDPQFLFVIGGV